MYVCLALTHVPNKQKIKKIKEQAKKRAQRERQQ